MYGPLITTLLLVTANSFTIHTTSTNAISKEFHISSTWKSCLSSTIQPSSAPVEQKGETVPSATGTDSPQLETTNQAKYGDSMDLPNTYVRCGRCSAAYALMASDIGEKGRRVECSLCPHSWYQTPERLFTLEPGHELSPLPEADQSRINNNIQAGRSPDFMGEIKFYVGNLDFAVTEEDLSEMFSEYGAVGNVSLATGPDGRSRGFAFVSMMDKSVEEACMVLDGKDMNGRTIKVNLSTS